MSPISERTGFTIDHRGRKICPSGDAKSGTDKKMREKEERFQRSTGAVGKLARSAPAWLTADGSRSR
jgi:hypothetical protein